MTSTVYQPTASQWASAATHLENRSEWRTVRLDGVRYVVLVSGNSGRVYMVRADARGCGCLWSQRAATPCSHRLAVELAATEDELAEQPSPAPASIPAPTHGARSLTDLAAQDALDEIMRQSRRREAGVPKPTAEDLFGRTCRAAGCTDDASDREPYCRRHVLAEVF